MHMEYWLKNSHSLKIESCVLFDENVQGLQALEAASKAGDPEITAPGRWGGGEESGYIDVYNQGR